MKLLNTCKGMVILMNKTLNFFAYYTAPQIIKTILMFLIISVIPIIATIIGTVNIVLLMIPSYNFVISIMAVIIALIIFFATYIFITTLKQYGNHKEVDYETLLWLVAVPLTFISSLLSYFISSLFV